jgi:site-specific DNA-methyltransferase (adenine-specific)
MCPREVCTVCGTPRRRITTEPVGMGGYHQANDGGSATGGVGRTCRDVETLGWTSCGCDASYRPGVVLDPFGGSGTVGAVATGHGRDAILVDLDERNAELAQQRIGMLCAVETLEATS